MDENDARDAGFKAGQPSSPLSVPDSQKQERPPQGPSWPLLAWGALASERCRKICLSAFLLMLVTLVAGFMVGAWLP